MSWTKRQIVIEAYSSIGITDSIYDIDPEQLQRGVRRLDAIMLKWDSEGIYLSYSFALDPDDADLDTPTNLPLYAVTAIYLALAINLAPTLGKAVTPDMRTEARQAFQKVLSRAAMPEEQEFTTLSSGAGNKSESRVWNAPFLRKKKRGIKLDQDDELDFTT